MGCVRKRGKSWNAQVRMSGWREKTKSFKSLITGVLTKCLKPHNGI